MGIIEDKHKKKANKGKDDDDVANNNNKKDNTSGRGGKKSASLTSSSQNRQNQQQQQQQNNKKEIEYNPRWIGYTAIAVTSLINLCAVSNIVVNYFITGHPAVTLAWAVISFAFAFLVLAFDRSQCFVDKFDYTKAYDGKLEGYALLFLTVYWIVGVGITTQVDGVGYLTLNIYFSTWLILFSTIYTLNKWSESKDILSIEELTGLSATLKSWYALFLSSLVVCGTSINAYVYLGGTSSDAALGIAIGAVSAMISLSWICVHYKFIEFVTYGGWIEFGCAIISVVLWIAATAVITQDQGIGSTIVGVGCSFEEIYKIRNPGKNKTQITNCTIHIVEDNTTHVESCTDFLHYEIPGSNLYVFTWLCLASALHVCFRWKAQQALQFAQAHNKKTPTPSSSSGSDPTIQDGSGGGNDNEDDDDDDDDDLDEFEDAAY